MKSFIILIGIVAISSVYNYYDINNSIVEIYPKYINSSVKYELKSSQCRLTVHYKYFYNNIEYYNNWNHIKKCNEIDDAVLYLNKTEMDPVYISKYNPEYSVVNSNTY